MNELELLALFFIIIMLVGMVGYSFGKREFVRNSSQVENKAAKGHFYSKDEVVNDELVAVISAAVSVVIDAHHRIVHIESADEEKRMLWALEGKQGQFFSKIK